MGLRFKDELLQQIATGISQQNPKTKIGTLKVTFKTDDAEYDFGLSEALDAIANDLYWDERGNWSNATLARVTTI